MSIASAALTCLRRLPLRSLRERIVTHRRGYFASVAVGAMVGLAGVAMAKPDPAALALRGVASHALSLARPAPSPYGRVTGAATVASERPVTRFEAAETKLVRERYVSTPARQVSRTVPARYGFVEERVLLEPERQVQHYVPAMTRREADGSDSVVIPARVFMETQPARYGVKKRFVEVEPAHVVVETIAPTWSMRTRMVQLAPERSYAAVEPTVSGDVAVGAPVKAEAGVWPPSVVN